MSTNLVHVVDDDIELLNAITWLLKSVNIQTRAYQNPNDFLANLHNLEQGCVILDIRMPNVSGLEVLKTMRKRQLTQPVIVLSAYGDVPMAVQAIKSGAIDFICKPFNQQALLEVIQKALSVNNQALTPLPQLEETSRLYMTLTAREQQVLNLIVDGFPNKQIALTLDIAVVTVEMHRSNIMRKMQASNMAHLIKKAIVLKL